MADSPAGHSTCSTSVSSCDSLEDCTDLIEVISPEALLQIATNKVRDSKIPAISISERPLSGSFNIIYVIDFEDGLKCAARIPKHGTVMKFGASQARAMENELELLRVIREKTTVPVPQVYHYDTSFENALGAPFSLCSWLEGTPVCRLWTEDNGPTPLHQRRLRILDSLAEAMSQLNFFPHSSIGLPVMRLNGGDIEVRGTEPLQGRDMDKENNFWLNNADSMDGNMTLDRIFYYELGPFSSTAEYLRAFLNNNPSKPATTDKFIGKKRMMDIIIDAIDVAEKQADGAPEFVVTHADLDGQNVMISEDGSLTGLLDWDGIHVGPKSLGYAAYPSFITRDMSPSEYFWWSDDEYQKARAGSPAELQDLRKAYRTYFEKHAGATAKDTLNSHLYRAVERACRNMFLYDSIITKLARTCIDTPLFDFEVEFDGTLEKIYANSPSEENDQEHETEEEPMDIDWEPLKKRQSSSSRDSIGSTLYEEVGESIVRLGSWLGLPFVVIANFLASVVSSNYKQRTEEPDTLETGRSSYSSDHSLDKSQDEVREHSTATGYFPDSPTPLGEGNDLQIAKSDQDNEYSGSDADSCTGPASEYSGSDSESSSDVDSDAGPIFIDPNKRDPDWLFELFYALGQDRISDANIKLLRDRFVEKFTSEEVVEEWDLGKEGEDR